MKLKLTLIFAALSLTIMPVLSPSLAIAQSSKNEIRNGVDSAAGGANKDPKSIDTIINNIVNVLSAAVGVVAIIMIIVAGFRYVTSGGSSERISSAKNALVYALIGLVVATLAQVIAKFVINRVT